jgi:HSP20 family protein
MTNTLTQERTEQQNGARTERRYLSPRVNIAETPDEYILEAEMPGVNKEGLEVLLERNELTLVGRRTTEKPPGERVYRESRDNDYRRVFVLDPMIDTTRINARMENGVLFLNLPKSDQVKPRRIEIQ